MGWKIRRIIALFAILGIIFVQQSKYIELVYAKENWNPFEPQQEEEGKTESEKGKGTRISFSLPKKVDEKGKI